MGWMGGLGAGMLSYAETLGEKRKLDWQSEQAAIQHERTKNLETLRINAQRSLQKDSQQFQTGLEGQRQDFQIEQQGQANQFALDKMGKEQEFQEGLQDRKEAFTLGQAEAGMYLDGRKLTKAEYNALPDEEKAKAMPAAQYETQQKVDELEQLTKAAQGLEAAERTRKADQLKEVAMKDGVWSPEDELRDLTIRHGLGDLKTLLGSDKPMTAEMLKEINTMFTGNDEWDEADPATKIALARDAHKRLVGGGVSQIGTDNKGKVTISDPGEIKQVAQDVLNGEATQAELNKLSPETLAKVNAQIEDLQKGGGPLATNTAPTGSRKSRRGGGVAKPGNVSLGGGLLADIQRNNELREQRRMLSGPEGASSR